ncbi:MAG: ABC transporter ATP-binding protein [Treponema sp.]|jgi:branched-chain amino acid transport system ATP-binding protein|nr:ABC transporter ATP-binding protein [Treponema sp.]
MLKIENINAGYGDMHVLFDINLNVEEGEVVSLVGSNGAGKTTLLRIISGFLPVSHGTITYFNQDLLKVKAQRRADLGISHIPQGRGILGTLTVKENLIMGAYPKEARKNVQVEIENAYNKFPKLRERQNQMAGSLSGGEQQMLAIARALMIHPKLLMLDEPSLGLAPIVVEDMFEIISNVSKQEGVSILIVEQNLMQALSVADRAYVLETGHLVMQGSARELMENKDIQKAYLGL